MPHGKSTYVSGQSAVVRCLEGLNLQTETDERPRPYKVDKDFGKFYYLINRTWKQHVRKDQYCNKKEWIIILKSLLDRIYKIWIFYFSSFSRRKWGSSIRLRRKRIFNLRKCIGMIMKWNLRANTTHIKLIILSPKAIGVFRLSSGKPEKLSWKSCLSCQKIII